MHKQTCGTAASLQDIKAERFAEIRHKWRGQGKINEARRLQMRRTVHLTRMFTLFNHKKAGEMGRWRDLNMNRRHEGTQAKMSTIKGRLLKISPHEHEIQNEIDELNKHDVGEQLTPFFSYGQ